jgi:hypothetical protein
MRTRGAGAYASFGWFLLCAVLLVTSFGGCGKKGPPVPPQRPPLPQVTTLEGRLEGETIFLNWRPGEAARGIKAYVVLRSLVDPAKPPCPGCPRVFQRVGEIASDPSAEALQFSEPAAPGFIYTYKVQPLGTTGDPGPDSNAVSIDRSTP